MQIGARHIWQYNVRTACWIPKATNTRSQYNVEQYCRSKQDTYDNITCRMRTACWIPKATITHSQYVIFIALPLQQWLHERVSTLRHTYIVCLACLSDSIS